HPVRLAQSWQACGTQDNACWPIESARECTNGRPAQGIFSTDAMERRTDLRTAARTARVAGFPPWRHRLLTAEDQSDEATQHRAGRSFLLTGIQHHREPPACRAARIRAAAARDVAGVG